MLDVLMHANATRIDFQLLGDEFDSCRMDGSRSLN